MLRSARKYQNHLEIEQRLRTDYKALCSWSDISGRKHNCEITVALDMATNDDQNKYL